MMMWTNGGELALLCATAGVIALLTLTTISQCFWRNKKTKTGRTERTASERISTIASAKNQTAKPKDISPTTATARSQTETPESSVHSNAESPLQPSTDDSGMRQKGEAIAAPLPQPNMLAPVYEAICFRLPSPTDRCRLRATTRQLWPTVDDSWRDLQMLKITFADDPPTDHLMAATEGMATVQGETKDPDTGVQRFFTLKVRSVELVEFLKWIGPRLPTIVLKAPCGDDEECPPTSEVHRYPIIDVLSACADATVMPSVVDVTVESPLLLCDRSALDALIRWADYRRRAAEHDGVAPWRSLKLTLDFIYTEPEEEEIRRLKDEFGEAPDDIRPLLHDGCGDLMLHTNDPLQPDTPSNSWRRALKGLLTEKLREFGMRDPESDFELVLSRLQKLMDKCDTLKALDLDEDFLEGLQLRPTSLIYPKTLTTLKCDRLGQVPGELKAIADNCPLLKEVKIVCFRIDHADVVALTKLKQLTKLILEYDGPMLVETECPLTDHLRQMEPTSSPWPMLKMISVKADWIPHLLIGALINCCPKLTVFHTDLSIYDWSDEKVVARETMLTQLCRLPRLTALRCPLDIANGPPYVPSPDRHIEELITYSPHLQELCVGPNELNPMLSLRRLLKNCHELRTVGLYYCQLDLRSPDVVAMLLGIAADVGDRNRPVQILMTANTIGHVSQESLDEVVIRLPPGVVLWHSSFADRCLHGRRRCWQCLFHVDLLRRSSLVLAHSNRLQSIVVFSYLFFFP